MPLPTRYGVLLPALLLYGAGTACSVAQGRTAAPAFSPRLTSRFSAPSAAAAARPAPTTGAIMHRQTYLDGQQPGRQVRKLVAWSAYILPTLTWNSVSGTGTSVGVESPAAGLGYCAGVSVDVYVKPDWCAFSTGLWYVPSHAGFIHPAGEGGGLSTFRVHYLQLPVTMKLASANLFRTGRTYVQSGLTMQVNVAETVLYKASNLLYRQTSGQNLFKPIEVGLLLAAGYEQPISPRNALIINLQYQRGLTNSLRSAELVSKNNLLALGAGLRF